MGYYHVPDPYTYCRCCTNSVIILLLQHTGRNRITERLSKWPYISVIRYCFCLNPKLELLHLYSMASQRGQNELGVVMLLRFKGMAEVVRKSGQTEREVLRKPRTMRIRRGGRWSTGSKPAGRTQMGRPQQLSMESPHSLSW